MSRAIAIHSKGAVLITGASTGIGRACALQLDGLGHLVFAGRRKDSDAEALRKLGSDRLIPVTLDVTKPEQIAAAVEEMDETLGDRALLGVVNNAGIGCGGPLEFVDLDDLRWQFEVNVFGQIAVSQAVLPSLRRGEGGRVVNISSIAGKVVTPFMGPYCASKHALEALTDAMRAELKPWNIWVCSVEPGVIETPIWGKATDTLNEVAAKLPAEGRERYGKQIRAMAAVIKEGPSKGIPASRVSNAVVHALTARRPKTRYLVGSDARMGAFFRWLLPDRAFDYTMRRMNKLD